MPYLVAKRQKGGHDLYYWQPNAKLREQGWLPRRVAEQSNDLADAIREAQGLNRELSEWRAGATSPALKPETMPWLIRLYRSDARYIDLADSTKRTYEQCLGAINAWSERAGHPPLKAFTRKHVATWKRSMSESTPRTANYVMAVLRVLFGLAVDEDLIERNPAERQRLKATPPRDRVWTQEEVDAFCATACATGHPSLALAVIIGLNTGQREGDVLRLAWSDYDGATIRLRQSKTGRAMEITPTSELRTALDTANKVGTVIIINEHSGKPYTAHSFNHAFRAVRADAGLEGIRFMDLRRTAVVRLGEAGCAIQEIAAITGHKIDRAATILEHYLPRTREMGENAIARLEDYKANASKRRTKVGSSD